jgi:DNA-binding transcriptional MerR regulator
VLANAALRVKSPEAFRTISEVAAELDVPQHVLRFWEGRFAQIKPVKRAGGRRYYRPEDVDLLRGIRALLYREGFTIKGAQKILKDKGLRYVADLGRGEAAVAVAPAPAAMREPTRPAILMLIERTAEAVAELPPPAEPSMASQLAEEERVRLEILLAELLQLKARLRALARPF